jgi:hypothetical protein
MIALMPDAVSEINIPPLELLVTRKAIIGAVYVPARALARLASAQVVLNDTRDNVRLLGISC